MAYQKQIWEDGKTIVSADRMTNIEDGITNNDTRITNIVSAVNETNTNIGTLNNLQTENKTNIVSAVNEIIPKSHITKNDIVSFTPLAGTAYIFYGNCYYYRINNKVHIHLGLSNLTSNKNNTVFKMPSNLTPFSIMSGIGTASSQSSTATINVYPDGTCYVNPINDTYCLIDIEYDVYVAE